VPSRRHACRASTPGSRSPLRPDGYQPSGQVPSTWFLPTSTVSSARRSRVCCTPQPDQGSSRFTLTGACCPRPSEDGPEHGTLSGAPRDAVHTLRSLPFADSRTASLRPLPPCRYRPAEAGRRSDSVMLRSAEADPHVTEHEVPSRRRSDAGQPRTTPDGRSRTGARRGPGDQTRAGVGPPRALRLDPRANVRRRRLSCCSDRSRAAWRGAASRPPKRAGCGSVESSRSGSASRPCSVDEVRCRQATVAGDRRSFLPWALFPFEVPRAAGAFRRCLAGDLRSRSLEGRTRDTRRASASRAADQRDPSAGSPAASGRSPSSRQHRGGRSPATDRRLFSVAVVAPVSRPRG
jgi:hypothetical protein